jgi:hypothetical protein
VPVDKGYIDFEGSARLIVGHPDPEEGPFFIRADWGYDGDRLVCIGLHVWKNAKPSPREFGYAPLSQGLDGGLGGTDLRDIPLTTTLEALWAKQRVYASQVVDVMQAKRGELAASEPQSDEDRMALATLLQFTMDAEDVSHSFDGTRPQRVRSSDRDHFKRVAEVYDSAMRQPGRKRPTMAVETAFGVTYSTATKWIGHARQLGFLPPTTSGRPARSSVQRT